jgi:hypothetical protein
MLGADDGGDGRVFDINALRHWTKLETIELETFMYLVDITAMRDLCMLNRIEITNFLLSLCARLVDAGALCEASD